MHSVQHLQGHPHTCRDQDELSVWGGGEGEGEKGRGGAKRGKRQAGVGNGKRETM